MIDTLLKNRSRYLKPKIWEDLGLKSKDYLVLTMHRPANVDAEQKLEEMLREILLQTRDMPIIFPVHPRTKNIISKLNVDFKNIHFIEPLGYLEFNYLVKNF